jgi:lipopolysaccharide/colanic/teichoic acid biosynthesis glycosyltransferase
MNAKADAPGLDLIGQSCTSDVSINPTCKRSKHWDSPLRTGAKRLIDIVAASILLALLSPFLLVIGLLVALSSPGPILYRWRVVGSNGRPFVGYKFRSMVHNADDIRPSLLGLNEMTGPVFKLTNDPRVTTVGRCLRKFSLDELPQLWSVLRGDMSLVGPRPPLEREYSCFTPEQRLKLTVKPGVTCLWQVSGRNDIREFADWIRLDLRYIEQWSLTLDMKILLRTIPAVLLGNGR